MFVFIKRIFHCGSLFLSSLVSRTSLIAIPLSATPLNCISIKNEECKTRPKVININSNNPIFYPFSIKTNVVVIVIILIIHMQKFVFLIL